MRHGARPSISETQRSGVDESPPRRTTAEGFAAQWLTGNTQVVAAVCEQYRVPFARRLRERFRPRLAPDQCEEIVSLALGRAWEHRAEFAPASGAFMAWIWAITLHLAAEITRKPWCRQRGHETGLPPEQFRQIADPHQQALAKAGDENGKLVQIALAALPEIQRFILLADANSPGGRASSRVLAAERELAPSTIRWHRAQGRATLKAELLRLGYRRRTPGGMLIA